MNNQRDNSGALFKNDTAGKSENFPPYGGSVMIDGREYWVSGWVKEGAKGKFFSLAFKRKDDQQQQRPQGGQQSAPQSMDDEIPF